MFGKKNNRQRLVRSSSFGQKISVTRPVAPSAPSMTGLSASAPPAKFKNRTLSDVSGIVVIEDDSEDVEVGVVSPTEFILLRKRLNHLEDEFHNAGDPNASHFATMFSDLEKLKAEATRLAMKLEENLASLQKQGNLLENLLASRPDEQVFATSNVKVRVGEHVFHTSLR
jgi:hypothetical protein